MAFYRTGVVGRIMTFCSLAFQLNATSRSMDLTPLKCDKSACQIQSKIEGMLIEGGYRSVSSSLY